ncbi:MAG: DUF4292 domain-containing protein [Crocinitomicaceae bacterium]|nr:DUF4292 domain-containing protein [Crocinitomicaceae bacterium]
MIQSIKYGFVAVFSLLMVSCARKNTEGIGKLPKKKDMELMLAMDSIAEQSFDYFYAKISTKYKDSTQRVSFKTSLRVVQDSALNAMITYAKIPMIHSLLTKDSIKITNKREKCYILESLDYIKEQFSVDFSLHNVEELMLGFPIDYRTDKRYFQVNSTEGYSLCSHRKRDIKKNERQGRREVIMYYTLSPNLQELSSTMIESPEDSTVIYINYKTRQLVDAYLVPKEVSIRIITPVQEIEIEMDYRKTRINRVEKIHFVIPESYEECE